MVIDLRKCIGCRSCVMCCKAAHKNTWKRVNDCGITDYPERRRQFLHLSCMHCGVPACLSVCPTGATYQRPDGIVDINYERCAGCGYCIVACPYQARTIYDEEHDFEVNEMSRRLGVSYAETDLGGVCTKCNFCRDRIDAGLALGLRPGVDPEASPVCMNSCSAHAICFGDMDDEGDPVSVLVKGNKTSRLQQELGTEPSVYFIID
jgi:phenylacetyl-CoA:acceptor oxidoreductase subunit 1